MNRALERIFGGITPAMIKSASQDAATTTERRNMTNRTFLISHGVIYVFFALAPLRRRQTMAFS